LLSIVKEHNISIELSEKFKAYLNSFSLDFNEFNTWIQELFKGATSPDGKPFAPYTYQVDAAWKLLKYKKCCAELSTSSGKTLMTYMIFKWLYDVKKMDKVLFIVPSVELADQTAERYAEYDSWLATQSSSWSIGVLRSGLSAKEKEKVLTCDILFGTFQSLCKRDASFFSKFKVLIVDECHHTSAASIQNVINKCSSLEWTFGVTGTFPKDHTYNNIVIQSLLGPLIYKFKASDLIYKEKKGTPINVIFELMDWATDKDKMALFEQRKKVSQDNIEEGSKVLREEQHFVNLSHTRLNYICNLATKTKKNTLVLFGDIKGGYGQKIYDWLKENSEKDVFYCDGGTAPENREYAKKHMEDDKSGQTVIVASIGTFSEGIDVKNLHNIFLVNTAKSERIVRQMCGRGLRIAEGKDAAYIFDFVDDLRWSNSGRWKKDNYMWKHYLERKRIYQEQGFPTYEQKVDFKNELI